MAVALNPTRLIFTGISFSSHGEAETEAEAEAEVFVSLRGLVPFTATRVVALAPLPLPGEN